MAHHPGQQKEAWLLTNNQDRSLLYWPKIHPALASETAGCPVSLDFAMALMVLSRSSDTSSKAPTTKHSNSPVNPEPLCQKEEMNIIFNAFIDEKNIQKSPNVCDDGLETDFNDHSSVFEDQG